MTTDNTVETGLEAAAAPTVAAETPAPVQMTTAIGGAEVQTPAELPKEVYENAAEDNRQHNFVTGILEARAPRVIIPYKPPPIPSAIAEQTKREMEAGRARVAEFEATDAIRKQVARDHASDKWGSDNDKKTVSVFRPADFVPDQKKGQGRLVGGQTSEV